MSNITTSSQGQQSGHQEVEKQNYWVLVLGALGVVFGDIGTSPLYALRESFTHGGHLGLTPDNVLGILSLIFWTITLVISVKYMMFIMRADNKGQGGILSLMALALGMMRTIT